MASDISLPFIQSMPMASGPQYTPTSPVIGVLWSTTSGLFARINGATIGPFGTSSGSVSSIATTLAGAALLSGTNAFQGSSSFAGIAVFKQAPQFLDLPMTWQNLGLGSAARLSASAFDAAGTAAALAAATTTTYWDSPQATWGPAGSGWNQYTWG